MANDFFDQTKWSTVLRAGADDTQVRLAALERLLTRYRRPILLEFQSRARCAPLEAEELAHQFFHDCLRRDFLKDIDPARGRFRAFIKGCITNFLRDQHDKFTAQKRGGGLAPVSLDETYEDGTPRHDPAGENESPHFDLDRAWAREVLELALAELEQECVNARRGPLFVALKPFLQGDPENGGYSAAASRLGMNEGAVRVAAHRLRQRLGELIEAEIKQTVTVAEDWRDELRYFLELLGGKS